MDNIFKINNASDMKIMSHLDRMKIFLTCIKFESHGRE